MPRFSIILPTRNRPSWLPKAVSSVTEQTFPDWELVVLDNSEHPTFPGETPWDDSRVRYLHEQCDGLADAYTKAIAHSTGDIILPLGDDDTLPPDTLEHSDERVGDALWLCGVTLIRTPAGEVLGDRGGTQQALDITRSGTFWLGGAVHWKRELTDRLGGYLPEYDGAADFDLYRRFMDDSEPVLTSRVMYLYCDWPGTDSRMRPGNQQAVTARIAHGG